MGIPNALSKYNNYGPDFFQTPEVCVHALFQHPKMQGRQCRILDPCSGQGPIGKVAHQYGFETDEFDLYAEDPQKRKNFLHRMYDRYNMIVCNPPYSLKTKFIRRALRLADEVWMILPMQVVNYNEFHTNFLDVPQYSGILLMTPKFFMTEEYQVYATKSGGAWSYAWFKWEPQGNTSISWESYVDLRKVKLAA